MNRIVLAALASCALSFAAAAADMPSADPCRMVKAAAAQAEQGNPDAMEAMGTAYYTGECAEMNFSKAAEWYRKAAGKGSVRSGAALGAMYFNGQGVAQDYRESFRWLSGAAAGGSADAQYSLAVMYQKGLGTGKDIKEAFSWYAKACDSGVSDACAVTAADRFRRVSAAAMILKQQVELCYFDLGGLSGAEPNADTGATSCSSTTGDRSRGTGWDLGRAVKEAGNSEYVGSASVENGVITMTSKGISLDGKDSFKVIWIPFTAKRGSDSALNWKIADWSTCLEAGLCRQNQK